MGDLARSAFMQSFYGDMDSWLLVSLLLLAAGIYRELVVLPARRAEYERDTVHSRRFIIEFLWIWFVEIGGNEHEKRS